MPRLAGNQYNIYYDGTLCPTTNSNEAQQKHFRKIAEFFDGQNFLKDNNGRDIVPKADDNIEFSSCDNVNEGAIASRYYTIKPGDDIQQIIRNLYAVKDHSVKENTGCSAQYDGSLNQYALQSTGSCTINALEAALQLHFFLPSIELSNIIVTTAAEYKGDKHTEIDDIKPHLSRYNKALNIVNDMQGTTKPDGIFDEDNNEINIPTMENVVGNLSIIKNAEYNKSISNNPKPVSCILTKPPETIFIHLNDENEYILYDSHPRPGKGLKNSHFLIFKDDEQGVGIKKGKDKMVSYLKELFGYVQMESNDLASQQFNMFNATFLTVGDEVTQKYVKDINKDTMSGELLVMEKALNEEYDKNYGDKKDDNKENKEERKNDGDLDQESAKKIQTTKNNFGEIAQGILQTTYDSDLGLNAHIHGGDHAVRTALLAQDGIKLLEKYSTIRFSEEEKLILQFAALYHDAGRDGEDGIDTAEMEAKGARLFKKKMLDLFGDKDGKIIGFIDAAAYAIINKDNGKSNVEGKFGGAHDKYQLVIHFADLIEVMRARSIENKTFPDEPNNGFSFNSHRAFLFKYLNKILPEPQKPNFINDYHNICRVDRKLLEETKNLRSRKNDHIKNKNITVSNNLYEEIKARKEHIKNQTKPQQPKENFDELKEGPLEKQKRRNNIANMRDNPPPPYNPDVKNIDEENDNNNQQNPPTDPSTDPSVPLLEEKAEEKQQDIVPDQTKVKKDDQKQKKIQSELEEYYGDNKNNKDDSELMQYHKRKASNKMKNRTMLHKQQSNYFVPSYADKLMTISEGDNKFKLFEYDSDRKKDFCEDLLQCVKEANDRKEEKQARIFLAKFDNKIFVFLNDKAGCFQLLSMDEKRLIALIDKVRQNNPNNLKIGDALHEYFIDQAKEIQNERQKEVNEATNKWIDGRIAGDGQDIKSDDFEKIYGTLSEFSYGNEPKDALYRNFTSSVTNAKSILDEKNNNQKCTIAWARPQEYNILSHGDLFLSEKIADLDKYAQTNLSHKQRDEIDLQKVIDSGKKLLAPNQLLPSIKQIADSVPDLMKLSKPNINDLVISKAELLCNTSSSYRAPV